MIYVSFGYTYIYMTNEKEVWIQRQKFWTIDGGVELSILTLTLVLPICRKSNLSTVQIPGDTKITNYLRRELAKE